MTTSTKNWILAAAVAVSGLSAFAEEPAVLTVDANKIGAPIQPTMYGLFFEDINYGADGGLYAEKIKNRSFEFPNPLMGWSSFGAVEVKNDGPFERNPHYIRLSQASHGHKHTGLDNEGFFGVTFEKGKEYRFSVWAREQGKGDGKLRVELIDPASGQESQVYAKAVIDVNSPEWKKYTVTLTPSHSADKGKLRLFLAKPDKDAVVDVEHISLFPVDTWNGYENGLRKDLMQALADLKPGVFRFPGGCIVEGTEIEDRYQWKNTVGPVENRPLNQNRWHYTFPHRFYPDYYQSYGLGFYEYFLLSEEIGAEPLPVLNVGLACQYQNNDMHAHIPVDSLDEYIQDALDLIEFANGDTSTKWGALRAEMGHPESFNLKFLGVGNEQWGPEYVERLAEFVKVLRKEHPEIKIIGSSGPDSEGGKFDYLWPEMKKLDVDLVDEHFYRPEKWFENSGMRYDGYDRKGPKVFAGEYASHGKGKKYNHYNTALLEAAMMTGLERNADIVHMATYAPLFAHVEGWQWRPDLIWFDNSKMSKTSSYNVQQLYAVNKGSNVVPLTFGIAGEKTKGKPLPAAGLEGQRGIFASAVYDAPRNEYIVKVVNTSDSAQPVRIDLRGLNKLKKGKASVASITMDRLASTSAALDALEGTNLELHSEVKTSQIPVSDLSVEKNISSLSAELPAKTFTLYHFVLN